MRKSKNQTQRGSKKSAAQSQSQSQSFSGSQYNGNPSTSGSQSHSSSDDAFHNLLEGGLKDLLWVEKELVKTIPKLAKKAESQELKNALEEHLEETREHAQRLTQVFKMLGKSPDTKKCEAITGIIGEGEEHVSDNEGRARDAAIIASAQKVEHYEIAAYGTLCAYANTLGLDDVADILSETLREEKAADQKLSRIAEYSINEEAFAGSRRGGMRSRYSDYSGQDQQRYSGGAYGSPRNGGGRYDELSWRGPDYQSPGYGQGSRYGSQSRQGTYTNQSNRGRSEYSGPGYRQGYSRDSGYGQESSHQGSGSGYSRGSRYGQGFVNDQESGRYDRGSGRYGRSSGSAFGEEEFGNEYGSTSGRRSSRQQGYGDYSQGFGSYGSSGSYDSDRNRGDEERGYDKNDNGSNW